MDWQQYGHDAQQEIARATSPAELEEARVRYLGRRSELVQALRGVRDRESGMLLNGVRGRLEAAVAERHDALESEALEALYAQSSFDVTLPGEPFRRGRLHLLTQVKREIEDV